MILPIVVYYGLGEWTVPLSLVEMIDATEGVDDPFRGFVYSLGDLHRLGPWQLTRHPEFQAVPVAFWIIFEHKIFLELIWWQTGGPVDESQPEGHVIGKISEKLNID